MELYNQKQVSECWWGGRWKGKDKEIFKKKKNVTGKNYCRKKNNKKKIIKYQKKKIQTVQPRK